MLGCLLVTLVCSGFVWGQPLPQRHRTLQHTRLFASDLLAQGLKPHKIYRPDELDPVEKSWRPARPPVFFERNSGQADRTFQFVLRGPAQAAGFHRSGLTSVVSIRSSESDEKQPERYALRLEFVDGRASRIEGQQPLTAKVNLIRGKDRSRWRTGLEAFGSIRYRELYRGIDMVASAADGRVEYGFALAAGADHREIKVKVGGVERLRLDRKGNLLMVTDRGTFLQTAPTFLEGGTRGGKPRRLEGRFEILGRNVYGFQVEGRRSSAPLVIDPELVLVSYFGGSGSEGTLGSDGGATLLHQRGFDIALGEDGDLFVAGTTTSVDFPATAEGPLQGDHDAFAMRFDPSLAPGSQLVYASFVGGSGFERGVGITAGDDESAYLIGCSGSSDFPTSANAVQPQREASVGYVVQLDPQGVVTRGTFIGRALDHHPSAVVYSRRSGEDGFVYIAGGAAGGGATVDADATTGVVQGEFKGGGLDGFVVKLKSDLTSLSYLTYLGGTARDHVMDLAVNDGFAFVTGSTNSIDFPTTELANQATHSQASDCTDPANDPRSCFDAFAARVHRDGSSLIYSTYLGGEKEEFGRGIDVSSGNQATIAGAARGVDGSQTEIVAMRLEGGGENLLWEQRLDASGRDHGEEVIVDGLGRAHLVGDISTDGLSTSERSFQGGGADMFYARLDGATGGVEYFTYLGGEGTDFGFAVEASGSSAENFCAVVAGSTTSENIETVNPLQGGDELSGGSDLLLVSLCDLWGDITGSGFRKSCTSGRPGDTITCTITIDNGGDVGVPVTITDDVPGELVVTGVQGDGCARNNNTVTCLTVIPPGSTSILITARIPDNAPCPRSLRNEASIQVGSNTFTGDAMISVTCPPPDCPDGDVDSGEQCDDGNYNNFDNCRNDCTIPLCGDGILDSGESCDEGSDNSDGTNATCTTGCSMVVSQDCDGSPPCAGSNVCGQRCTMVPCDIQILGMCIFSDEYWLCSLPECMPSSEATFEIGD